MGRLKWDVETVHKALDELEEIIQKVKPIQAKVDRKARKLRKMKHLPQYVTQRVDNLIFNNKAIADRAFANVRSVRSALPEIERQGTKKRYPVLVEGQKYQVVLGDSMLTRKVESRYHYAHDESTNLHVGDIVTYKGQQTGLLTKDDGKPHDTFAFADFIGYFMPSSKGKANRAYLEAIAERG